MKNSIYEYEKYKLFLNDLIRSKGSEGRGIKKSLAVAIGCQSPFISQVLSGNLDFNNDQALACAKYFGLNQDETEYLLLLISLSRAATSELRKFLIASIESKKQAHREIKSRMKMKDTLDKERQSIYYSSWIYSATHMALTIPELRTREALSEKLQVPLETIDRTLDFLVRSGLVQKSGVSFTPTNFWYHLDKSSPMISKHHTNLHIKSMQSLDQPKEHDVHYSAFFTCSRKDLAKLEELLLKTLADFNELVRPSNEEQLVGINLNLFRM